MASRKPRPYPPLVNIDHQMPSFPPFNADFLSEIRPRAMPGTGRAQMVPERRATASRFAGLVQVDDHSDPWATKEVGRVHAEDCAAYDTQNARG